MLKKLLFLPVLLNLSRKQNTTAKKATKKQHDINLMVPLLKRIELMIIIFLLFSPLCADFNNYKQISSNDIGLGTY